MNSRTFSQNHCKRERLVGCFQGVYCLACGVSPVPATEQMMTNCSSFSFPTIFWCGSIISTLPVPAKHAMARLVLNILCEPKPPSQDSAQHSVWAKQIITRSVLSILSELNRSSQDQCSAFCLSWTDHHKISAQHSVWAEQIITRSVLNILSELNRSSQD